MLHLFIYYKVFPEFNYLEMFLNLEEYYTMLECQTNVFYMF